MLKPHLSVELFREKRGLPLCLLRYVRTGGGSRLPLAALLAGYRGCGALSCFPEELPLPLHSTEVPTRSPGRPLADRKRAFNLFIV